MTVTLYPERIGGSGAGSAANTGGSFVPNGSSVPSNGMYLPAANTLGFATNSTAAMRLDSSQRLLIGATTSQLIAGISPRLQIAGTTGDTSGGSFIRYNASNASGHVVFGRSRNATQGSQTIMNNSDLIWNLDFAGSDGTNIVAGASILASVNGTPATGKMPMKLEFQTAPAGSGTLTTGLALDSAQNVIQGTAALAVGATAGLMWLASCPGTPNGAPTAPYTNAAAMIVDTTGSKLWVLVGSTWKSTTLA